MKKFILLLALILIVSPLFAARIIDDAMLVSESDKITIEERLNSYSQQTQLDFLVLTVKSTEGKDAIDYADKFMDYNGYSQAILFFIDMGERVWYISTTGSAVNIFNNGVLDDMEDALVPYLSSGDFTGAFLEFADFAGQYVIYGDTTQETGEAISILTVAILGAVFGLLVGLIVTSIQASKHKNVKMSKNANNYVVPNSFYLTDQSDIFLYANLRKVAKSSSNGSSTHRSPSGVRHGGRSGHF